jgi:Fe-S cluster biosynthesis and repair protein YggX
MSEPRACTRCGRATEGLGRAPFPARGALAELSDRVATRVCPSCWTAWRDASVKLVNEWKLDLAQPDAQARWITSMRAFLNLDGTRADPWMRFLDRPVRVDRVGDSPLHGVLVALTNDSLTVVSDHARTEVARDAVIALEIES